MIYNDDRIQITSDPPFYDEVVGMYLGPWKTSGTVVLKDYKQGGRLLLRCKPFNIFCLDNRFSGKILLKRVYRKSILDNSGSAEFIVFGELRSTQEYVT